MKINSIEKILKYTLIGFLCIFAITIFVRKVSNLDIGYHLKTGEYIVKNLKLPITDIHSHTVPDHKYMDSHWLFQIILYLCYLIGKIPGIIILKTIILFMSFFILAITGYKSKNYIISLCLIYLAIMASSDRFFVRPEIFTFLFIVLYLYILELYIKTGTKIVFIIPFVQLLWTNMHGLFILGVVIIWSFIISEFISERINFRFICKSNINNRNFKILFIVGIITTISCFVTPYGMKGVLFPFLLFSQVGETSGWMKTVTEFVPPLSKQAAGPAITYYKILIALVIISFLITLRKVRLSYLVLSSAFLYLSLIARRNIPLFSFVSSISIVYNLNTFIDYFEGKNKKITFHKIKILFSIFTIVILVYSSYDLLSNKYYIRNKLSGETGFGFSSSNFPEKAVDFIISNNIRGNVLNDNLIGGYLIWRFSPERKIFIDGRWDVYGDEFLEIYQNAFDNIQNFTLLADKYKVNYILLSHKSTEAKVISKDLYQSENWKLIYLDDIASIYLRNSKENEEPIRKYEIDLKSYREDVFQEYKPGYVWISTLMGKGILFYNMEEYNIAMDVFKKVIDIDPLNYDVINNIGNIYMNQRNFQSAINYYEKALKIKRDHFESAYNLANAYMENDELDKAEIMYKKVIRLNPKYLNAHARLDSIYAKRKQRYSQNDETMNKSKKSKFEEVKKYLFEGSTLAKKGMYEEAIKQFQKAIQMQPNNPDAHYNLGVVYWRQKKWNKVVAEFEKVKEINPNYKNIDQYLSTAKTKIKIK